MNRAMIRARIDALECLTDTQQAISEVEATEFDKSDSGLFDVHVTCNTANLHITFIKGVPPSVLVAGLRAMEAALCEMSGMEVVA